MLAHPPVENRRSRAAALLPAEPQRQRPARELQRSQEADLGQTRESEHRRHKRDGEHKRSGRVRGHALRGRAQDQNTRLGAHSSARAQPR